MATHLAGGTRRPRRKLYSANVRVRCTPEEHRAILANARRANRSASRFLVELGTRRPDELLAPAPAPEELQVLESMLFQLHRLGVNLNQLVHLRHADPERNGSNDSSDRELAELLASLCADIGQLRERLR